MASVTVMRPTVSGPPVPSRGTFSAKANTLYPKGTIVTRDSAGRAISPATADVTGNPAVGVSANTYDNRTGSPNGGLDDSIEVEVEYGVFGFDYTGTPLPGETVWVVDNHTVADSSSGGRGVAGVVSEVRDGQCFVWMGPHVASLFSDDSALESDVTTLRSDVDDLQADALSAQAVIHLPLGAFRVYADGEALVPFDDGVADGFDPTAESLGYRFNVGSTAAIAASCPIPADLDDAEDVVVHAMGYRVGSADATAALTVAAFFRTVGAAFSADANAGGDTSAFDGATTVVTEETVTIAAANVPAHPASLLLTIVPTAALDADDLVVLDVWIEYTRKLRAS